MCLRSEPAFWGGEEDGARGCELRDAAAGDSALQAGADVWQVSKRAVERPPMEASQTDPPSRELCIPPCRRTQLSDLLP